MSYGNPITFARFRYMPGATPPPKAALALPGGLDARYAQLMAQVEAQLASATKYSNGEVQRYTQHLLSAGGKRLRPLLTLLTAEFGDPTRPEIIDAAVAVELTHLASLYHDDVMDSAPLRRGAPSAHTLWGNHAAILTGDLLFAKASSLTAGLGPQAVRIQAEMFERLVLGQLHETLGPRTGENQVEFYLQVLRDKTASLIATAARYGAMFAQAPPNIVKAVAAYGELLGVAFQLADDVLDLTARPDASGKLPGTDLREAVLTMPVLLLRQRVTEGTATEIERSLLTALNGDLTDDATLAAVLAELQGTDVLAETQQLAASYAAAAINELARVPDGAAKQALEALAQASVTREH